MWKQNSKRKIQNFLRNKRTFAWLWSNVWFIDKSKMQQSALETDFTNKDMKTLELCGAI